MKMQVLHNTGVHKKKSTATSPDRGILGQTAYTGEGKTRHQEWKDQ